MKKLLLLSLLASFAQAHCNTENPTAEEKSPVRVSMFLNKIPSYHYEPDYYTTKNTAFLLEAALAIGCGVTLPTNNKDTSSLEYDSEKYPQCKEVLNFLVDFNTAQYNLHNDAKKLVQKIAQSNLN